MKVFFPIVSGCIASAAAAQVAVFQPLPLDPGRPPGVPPNSFACDVSGDGRVVAGGVMRESAGLLQPAFWVAGASAWQLIPDTGSFAGLTVSQDGGRFAGTYFTESAEFLPFVYQPGQAALTLTALAPAAFYAMSGDGLVAVGGAQAISPLQAGPIRWSLPAGPSRLAPVPGCAAEWGDALGVSGNGSVIVGVTCRQAFRWSGGTMQMLGFLSAAPGQDYSLAAAVSADGSTVVGSGLDGQGALRAFTWRAPGPMHPLPLLGTTPAESAALDVSGDGSMIVGWQSSPLRAYSWDRVRGKRDLKQLLTSLGATGLQGWTLTGAVAISPDGRHVVGNGIDPNGREHAWLAHLPALCYANCDASNASPVLNVTDFTCFLTRFAANDQYANCDNSTAPPVLNVADFVCFQQKFAAGCP